MKKKIIACVTGLAMVAIIVPSSAQAVTAAELQAQIDALMAQLADLQSQLAELTEEGVEVSCTFTRNLYPGMSGSDVKCLQQYLNSTDTKVASTGVGSSGNETEYYGPLTKAAVGAWQEANGVAYGNWKGYFGPKSQAKYDALAAVGEQEEEEEEEEEEEVAAGLTVSLASDTPAADNIADGANANFTKFSLAAGSEGDVKISKIYVTRSGLSDNSDVENIKIVDVETGEYKGSIGSLNVDNRAMVSFVPGLVISAGTSQEFYIRAGVPSTGATAGGTIILSIADGDIISDATEVNGLPVAGNAMEIVSLTVGSVTVSEIGTTVDSQPDVGDTDVIVLNWKAAAGSAEPLTIETVTVKRTGTADASDTTNIELYSVTDDKTLGTVAEWSADDKATWSDLNVNIGKGETHRFKIMLDVVGGVSATAQDVNVDMVDGSDCLVAVKGDTYGFYITPTSATSDWGANTAARRGQGTNDQTIQAGALVVSKSSSTPATGNIAAGDDIELAVFNFEAKGEEIKITALGLDFNLVLGGPMLYTEVTNVKLYDEDGNIVAGPKDASDNTTNRGNSTGGYLDYTDTFIVPIGIHEYTVKAKIADAVASSDDIQVAIDRPTTSITATGMTSNDSIDATPAADVDANTMTVAAAALTVETLAEPSGRSVAKGINDFVWATFSLDAGVSGEDINVTAITVTDTTTSASTAADINNAALWADLTDENSARGDVYETRISDLKQPSATTQAYVLNQTIKVPATSFIKIALVADLDADATETTHKFTVAAAGDVTSLGADTGSSFTETIVVTNAQTMTVTTGGVLTVTQDASAPSADIIIGGETSTLNVFRLAASNVEDLDLDNMTLYVTGGEDVDTYYFYQGDTLLASRPGGTAPRIDLVDGTVTIPANGNVKITVKAKMLPIDGSSVVDNTDVGATINAVGDIDTTGLSSGTAVDSTPGGVSGAVHQLYESRPYITVNSASPSGTTGDLKTTNTLLAIFDIEAHSKEDITFDQSEGQIIFSLSMSIQSSDGDDETFTFKDQDGNTLDTVTDVAIGSGSSKATSVTCDFSTKALTIPAYVSDDDIRKIYIYADTEEMTYTSTSGGDTIQVWLDDGTANSVKFSIDGGTSYDESAIILRGDIFAGTLKAS